MITWKLYGEAALTSLGFFWKAGWAFVLGYSVSAMIQAFVPKGRLTPYLGDASVRSVSLATLFGAASSSCSFAALATARALVAKGANFVAAVAFMFASTNLVIELGILNLLFALLAAGLVSLHRRHTRETHAKMDHQMETGGVLKRNLARLSIVMLLVGVIAYFSTS